jgi:glycosyltransferase involved in cell wall biosynthesis
MLVLGYHVENFLEGYASICLNNLLLYSSYLPQIYLLNANGFGADLTRIVSSLVEDENVFTTGKKPLVKVVEVRERKALSLFQTITEEILGKILNESTILVCWRPQPILTFLLYKSRKLIIPTYSCNYLERWLNILKSFRYINNTNVIILNPYIEALSYKLSFVKVYPPVNPLFFKVGSKALKEKAVTNEVVFRFLGRLHGSRGYREAVIAFKRFKTRNPSAKARLVIDSFRDDVELDNVKTIRIGDFANLVLWNPLSLVKRSMLSASGVLREIAEKYAQSSYVVLPYISHQFVEPPLTLMETLASGGFVIASNIIAPYADRDIVFKINRENIIEELAKAFEHLYEIYDSNYYWSIRQKAYGYALKNWSYEAVREKLLGVLDEVFE